MLVNIVNSKVNKISLVQDILNLNKTDFTTVLPRITESRDSIVVGDNILRLRFGKIIYEKKAKPKDEFDISVLEVEMEFLRKASKHKTVKNKTYEEI